MENFQFVKMTFEILQEAAEAKLIPQIDVIFIVKNFHQTYKKKKFELSSSFELPRFIFYRYFQGQ